MFSTRRTLLGALIATVVLSVGAVAQAAPPDGSGVVQRGPSFYDGFVYRGGGYIVLTGPAWDTGCLGQGFPEPTGMFVLPGNGSFQEHFTLDGESILVLDDTAGPALDDIWPWLEAACDAATDGDPSTVPPEPLAVGEGKVSFHLRVSTDGTANIHNWVNGTVETTDGRTVHLSTFAKFSDGPAGFSMQILRVNYGG